jgi:dolichyl-phosphate-mannose-protein mannosyltransferase
VALCTAVLLLCGYLRFVNLDWGIGKKQAGGHPDEVIVVGVVDGLQTNHFDTDLKRAAIPKSLQLSRYNFSSYEYCAYICYSAVTALEKFIRVLQPKFTAPSPVVVDRIFSACLGLAVCVLVYICARTFLLPAFALLATLFAGVLPVLVQDSHYARAESLVTAGTLAVIYLALGFVRKPSYKLCFCCAFLLGFLIASKVSLAALLYLPACAVWIVLEREHRRTVSDTLRYVATVITGTVAGFLLGVPYVLAHGREWWAGWKSLREQYSHPFPPHGPDPEGYCFGYIANYFWRTFGAALIILAIIGVIYLVRRKSYRLLIFFVSPLAVYYAIFGLQESFLERNFSHVVPFVAILAAAGCAELWERTEESMSSGDLRVAAIGFVVIFCLWVPLGISWRLAVKVLGGKLYETAPFYDTLIRESYKGLPIYRDDLFFIQSLTRLRDRSLANPNGFVIQIDDAGDETSQHRLFIAQHLFHMKLLATSTGHFADLPVSTLQIYHSENHSWYLVRGMQ